METVVTKKRASSRDFINAYDREESSGILILIISFFLSLYIYIYIYIYILLCVWSNKKEYIILGTADAMWIFLFRIKKCTSCSISPFLLYTFAMLIHQLHYSINIYVYIYIVCVCVCWGEREREPRHWFSYLNHIVLSDLITHAFSFSPFFMINLPLLS